MDTPKPTQAKATVLKDWESSFQIYYIITQNAQFFTKILQTIQRNLKEWPIENTKNDSDRNSKQTQTSVITEFTNIVKR